MFKLFHPDKAKRIEQEEALLNQEIVDLLGEIASGQAPMTDAMKEILELNPPLKAAWNKFEAIKSAKESAIDVQATEVHPRNSTSIITVK